MRVALLDFDMLRAKRRRAFPNLALMKLSSWHKKQGHQVSLNFPLSGTDQVYASCVFAWNKPEWLGAQVLLGGGGTGKYALTLPHEVEHIMPDYDLYPNVNWSMGYTTRGCIWNCPFCKVRDKEGYLKVWADPQEFYDPRFNKIIFLDNNILPADNCIDTFKWLVDKQLLADFNQGLDIRSLTDEHLYYLKRIRIDKYRFAFDNISYEREVRQGIELMSKAGINKRKLSFYVLVGFEKKDFAIERMKLLQSYGVEVYPMIYKGDDGKEPEVNYNFDETVGFHGARGNLRKFLRIAGRI